MTRRDLFASSLQFLLAGVLCTGVSMALWYLTDRFKVGPEWLPLASAFAGSVFGGMGVIASGYLLLVGCAREKLYDPAAVWQADREAWLDELEKHDPEWAAEERAKDSNP